MDCCVETWFLNHPHIFIDLQHSYAAAGSEIIYAPTFRALPMALAAHGLAAPTEKINRELTGDIGADLLAAKTLLHPLEAISFLTAAAREHAHTVMISFACKPDGTLYSGHTTEDCICLSTETDASAVGIISASPTPEDLFKACTPKYIQKL